MVAIHACSTATREQEKAFTGMGGCSASIKHPAWSPRCEDIGCFFIPTPFNSPAAVQCTTDSAKLLRRLPALPDHMVGGDRREYNASSSPPSPALCTPIPTACLPARCCPPPRWFRHETLASRPSRTTSSQPCRPSSARSSSSRWAAP